MQSVEALLGENSDGVAVDVEAFEEGDVAPGLGWQALQLVVGQLQLPQLVEAVQRDGVEVPEPVAGYVEVDEPGQGEGGQGEQLGLGEPEHLEPLGVVEQLLEVGSYGVEGEVEGEEGAEAHEDVVGEDGQPVVGQGEAEELEGAGEHGGVEVLDVVVGQVEVAQGLRHLGQG